MNDALLITSFILGACLGSVYFGGLWLTMIIMPAVRWRFLVLAGSYLLRVVVTLGGFYCVLIVDWKQLVACGVGFILVRQAIMHRVNGTAVAEDNDGDNP
jgi:F1F0 ATPase subunit 2